MKVEGKSFWCPLNVSENDVVTPNGSTIFLPKGNGVRLPCALFGGDPSKSNFLVTDLSNINYATLELRKTNASGERLIDPINIDVADFNAALTFDQWAARTSSHFSFSLIGDQTNWTIGGGWDGTLYFAFGINTSDYGDVTCGKATGKVYEDGIGGAATTPPINDPLYYTGAQSDLRYVRRLEQFLRLLDDGTYQFWNPDAETWHSLFIREEAGGPEIAIGEGVADDDPPPEGTGESRISSTSVLQLKNIDTGDYHNITVRNAAGGGGVEIAISNAV